MPVLHIAIVMKPMYGNNAQNVTQHNTAAFNIDASRISIPDGDAKQATAGKRAGKWGIQEGSCSYKKGTGATYTTEGRWPSNVILAHNQLCQNQGYKLFKSDGHWTNKREVGKNGIYGKFNPMDIDRGNIAANEGGKEVFQDWNCHSDCPVGKLDEQSGDRPSGNSIGNAQKGKVTDKDITPLRRGTLIPRFDKGGASRFFKQVKEK